MMNSSAIEKDGITSLRNFLSKSEKISDSIKDGDKEISWDGFLYIFNSRDNNNRKDRLKGRIAIQVKSTNRAAKTKETYSIKRADLKNYLNGEGALFIRPIFRTTTDYEIYIKTLLPITIKELLLNAKEDTNTISLDLEKIKDIKLFEAKCFHFLENIALQRNIENTLAINNMPVKEFMLEAKTILHGDKVFESLVSNDCYYYAKLEGGIVIPILDFPKDSLEFQREAKISVNSITYFELVTFFNVQEKDTVSCKFGNQLEFQFKTGFVHINYTGKEFGLFSEKLQTLRFLDAMNRYKSFEVDGIKVNLDDSDNDNFNIIQEELNFCEDINQFFTLFRFDTNQITLKEINNDYKRINELIRFFIKKEKVPIKDNSQFTFKHYKVCKKILIVFFKSVDNQFYEAVNFLQDDPIWESTKIVISEGVSISGSRFLALNNIELVQFMDGYFEEVQEDLIRRFDKELSDVYRNFMLSCIHCFDSTNKIEFLTLAKAINDKVNEETLDEQLKTICTINQLQIIKRQRELTKEEKDILFDLKIENQEMKAVCCAKILLNSFDEFDIVFNRLEDDDKEMFKSWPIWNLYRPEQKK
ncbi:MAG: hypothetical protein SFU98_15635 [Leptospiraceae bacterium]|nr:hypothetical protein [Leptospiraceae bacterium]